MRTVTIQRSMLRSSCESCEPRRLLAAISWDAGGDGVNWNDGLNWSTNGIPGSADDVTINVAANPTILLNGANATVHSLNCAESMDLSSGTLEVAAASSIAGTVTLNGAAIGGDGNLTLAGTVNWGVGSFYGAGKLILPTGSIANLSGFSLKTLDRTLDLSGTLNYTGSGFHITWNTNVGSVNILSGATFNIAGDNNFDGGTVNLSPGGTLIKSAGAGDASIGSPLITTGGTINSASGKMLFSNTTFGGGVNLASDFVPASGGTVQFNPGYSFAGPGVVHLFSGTTFTGTPTLQKLIMEPSAGLFSDVDLTVASLFDWRGGAFGGIGKLILPTGSIANLSGFSLKTLDRTLDLSGTLNYTGSGFHITWNTQVGSVNILSGATFNIAGDNNFDGGTLNLASGATLIKSAGAGDASIGSTVSNLGVVRASSGTLVLPAALVDHGAFLSGGVYRVTSGGNISFGSGLTTFTGDLEIDGTGTATGLAALEVNRGRIALTGGADLTVHPLSGPYTQQGILDLSPGSVFTVEGDMKFAGISQPVIRTELASASSFGRVAVTGALDLNSPDSTSRFDPDLVSGYNPALNSRHDVIVAAGGISNAFDSFQGGATPSNNILLATRPNAQTVAVQVGPGPLPPSPQILSQTFEFQTREAIVFNFDQDVSAFLGRRDYQIMNLTTNTLVPQSAGTLTYNQASNQAILTVTGELPDANYRLTVNASDIANAAGVPASGSPIVLNFFILRGDATRDRVVNFDDLLIVAQNYGQSGRNFSQGNVDYSADGVVGFDDLLILAQRYGRSLLTTATLTPSKKRDSNASDLIR